MLEHSQVHELYKKHGTFAEVARQLNVSKDAVRRAYYAGLRVEKEVPLSENTKKITDLWTKEQCIAALRAIAEAEPDKVITRNYFRVNGPIAESVWNRHFGTFEEFKRQAGITISRHAHRLEKSIAKHASVDILRQMNQDKADWGDAYLKPNGKRFKSILAGSDIHDIDCDPFWRRTFVDTARRAQPDVICLTGDIFDLPEFSKYSQDPREWDPITRIKWVHEFLRELREACPDAEIYLIEGNHEFRMLRHLAEASPAMRTILADLHGFTIPKLLGLDQFEVNFIARADLTAFNEKDIKDELRKNWHIFYNAVLAHHFPEGRNMGIPGWNGHHHRHFVWSFYSPTYGTSEWHQLGAGHKREAVYCAGEQWGNGHLLAHIDTQRLWTQMEYHQVLDHCVIGGKMYTRNEDEVVTGL